MQIAEKYVELGKKYYPTWATWEVTSRCNAICKYCYLGESKNTTEDIETDRMYEIADKIYESGALFVTLTGGEPFIRKDILSILEYLFRKDFFSVTLFSNGTLMHDEHVRFLTENKNYLRNLQFSVFSHDPKINDFYFGITGALEHTLFIGKQLIDSGIPVTLALNLFDFNVREFEKTKRIFLEMGYSVRICFCKLTLNYEHEQQISQDFSEYFYTAFLDNINQSDINKIQSRLAEKSPLIRSNDSLCYGLFTNIAIDSTGNILPCIAFRKLPLGSIFEKRSIREILTDSPALKQIRSLRKNDMIACTDCKFLNECAFCLGMMHTRYNDFKKPLQQYCTYLKTLGNYSCQK